MLFIDVTEQQLDMLSEDAGLVALPWTVLRVAEYETLSSKGDVLIAYETPSFEVVIRLYSGHLSLR